MNEIGIFAEPKAEYSSDKDFTSLMCWHHARDLKLFCYNKVIPRLPAGELHNLSSQIKRAAISATANIAEGYGRYNFQESIQFYWIARASIYETKDHLISCFDLKYIDKILLDEGLSIIESAKMKLSAYINYVKRQKEKSN